MFRSIRWTLQLWHAVLLLGVVCLFGGVLYGRLSQARMRAVDAEILAMAEGLSAKIRPPRGGGGFGPGPRGEGLGFGDGRPGGGRHEGGRPGEEGPPPTDMRRRNDSEPPRGEGGRPDGNRFFDEFEKRMEVPESVLYRFEGDSGAYFAVWKSSGELFRASRGDVPFPGKRVERSEPAPVFRQRGDLREVIVPTGPVAMQVLVGRSIAKERAELKQLLMLLGGTGAGAMILGLAGGWVLAGRVVRPIGAIAKTAQSISATNLSQRIDVAGTQSELGTLAVVLNAMFGRLESAFEQQVRFTADASHELRTPLSIIYSHAELALAKERPAEEYREAIEACFRAAKRMRGLVESLLVLARADAGKLEIRREEFDLGRTVEDCVDLLRPLAAEKKVGVHVDIRPVRVAGDAARMAQVVTNLIGNAIHYNREGGSVNVGVGVENDEAVIAVADTGVGIPEDDQKHLFERFFRVDKARSRAVGGTGLGLAISKSIVEAHGGKIEFESKVGEGTRFVVKLNGASRIM